VGLGEAHPQVFLEQRRQADGGLADQLRGNACIEQTTPAIPVVAIQNAHVVIGVVKHLLDTGITQQSAQRCQVGDRQRVHDRGIVAGGHLEEIDPVDVPMKARRFGVDCREARAARARDDVGERLRGIDEAIHAALRRSLLPPELLQPGRDLVQGFREGLVEFGVRGGRFAAQRVACVLARRPRGMTNVLGGYAHGSSFR
jgi:hypothetical protein